VLFWHSYAYLGYFYTVWAIKTILRLFPHFCAICPIVFLFALFGLFLIESNYLQILLPCCWLTPAYYFAPQIIE